MAENWHADSSWSYLDLTHFWVLAFHFDASYAPFCENTYDKPFLLKSWNDKSSKVNFKQLAGQNYQR